MNVDAAEIVLNVKHTAAAIGVDVLKVNGISAEVVFYEALLEIGTVDIFGGAAAPLTIRFLVNDDSFLALFLWGQQRKTDTDHSRTSEQEPVVDDVGVLTAHQHGNIFFKEHKQERQRKDRFRGVFLEDARKEKGEPEDTQRDLKQGNAACQLGQGATRTLDVNNVLLSIFPQKKESIHFGVFIFDGM